MQKQHRSRVDIGNRKIALQDVINIASNASDVCLDSSALEKLDAAANGNLDNGGGNNQGKGKRKKKQQQQQQQRMDPSHNECLCLELPYDDADAWMADEDVRAIIICRIVNIMHGRSGIPASIAAFFADILNHGIIPHVPLHLDDDETPLKYIAMCAVKEPKGVCHFIGDNNEAVELDIADALAKAGIESPSMTVYQFKCFQQCRSSVVGLSALCVYAVSALLDLADAVAALSCEAHQAYTRPYDKMYHDDHHPHKGAMAVANHLRNMLEDSELVNKSKRATRDSDAFRLLAQYQGPSRSVFEQAAAAMRVELNSAESSPPTIGPNPLGIGVFHLQPLITTVINMHGSLGPLARGSVERTRDLAGSHLADTSFEPLKAAEDGLNLLLDHITQLPSQSFMSCIYVIRADINLVKKLFSIEATAALFILAEIEEKVVEKQRLAQQKKQAALEKQRQHEEKMIAEGKETPAAAAAAGKKKKKKKKKDNSQQKTLKGITLGRGTRRFRAFLMPATTTTAAADDDASSSSLVAATGGDLKQLLDTVIERLKLFSTDLRTLLSDIISSSTRVHKPRIAKGTRDFEPLQMAVRRTAFDMILNVFRRHGAVGIDTPVFELKDTLTNKYGEDSKLIFDLADQGGEMLALRYDLTVPFARYLAMHSARNIKRYHIARVYRRDQPQMNRGRFREFYQCDYDIAGVYDEMVPDSEVLKVLCEILSELPIGPFKVKLNHRALLDALMDVCGVPPLKFRAICSAIDKLDKAEWPEVRHEMVHEKGLHPDVADRIAVFVMRKGTAAEMLAWFDESDDTKSIREHPTASVALNSMRKLFEYLECFGCLQHISFDMSLARGLDYYTGVIYEAILTTPNQVGSIAAGGRYDNLVGMFSGQQVPAVGVSIGIERIFAIMEAQERKQSTIRECDTEVLVCSVGKGMLPYRMKLCAELWSADIRAEILYKDAPKPNRQLEYALERAIPFTVWLGEDEVAGDYVRFKVMKHQTDDRIDRGALVEHILELKKSPLPIPSKDDRRS